MTLADRIAAERWAALIAVTDGILRDPSTAPASASHDAPTWAELSAAAANAEAENAERRRLEEAARLRLRYCIARSDGLP